LAFLGRILRFFDPFWRQRMLEAIQLGQETEG
jgi:hypothetical protein